MAKLPHRHSSATMPSGTSPHRHSAKAMPAGKAHLPRTAPANPKPASDSEAAETKALKGKGGNC